jgi:hypothetical protein
MLPRDPQFGSCASDFTIIGVPCKSNSSVDNDLAKDIGKTSFFAATLKLSLILTAA